MNCRLVHDNANWTAVFNAAKITSGGTIGETAPTSEWKHKILMAEHSPIRLLTWTWLWEDLPSWVSVHFVRHKIGCEHFVKSQRTDRTGIDRTTLPQNAFVNHLMTANAQAIIAISRKRMCKNASLETRSAWRMALNLLPIEIQNVCVPDCVYRGKCFEMRSCDFDKTTPFVANRRSYGLL